MLTIPIISEWMGGELGLCRGDGVVKYVLEVECGVGMLTGWLSLYGDGMESKQSTEDCGGYFLGYTLESGDIAVG